MKPELIRIFFFHVASTKKARSPIATEKHEHDTKLRFFSFPLNFGPFNLSFIS